MDDLTGNTTVKFSDDLTGELRRIMTEDSSFHSTFDKHLSFGNDPLLFGRVAALPLDLQDRVLAAEDEPEFILGLLQEKAFLLAALYTASPVLHSIAHEWLSAGTIPSARALRKLRYYVLRMTSRTTPFGLFAGVGAVRIGASSDLSAERYGSVVRVRPDGDWLYAAHTFASRRDPLIRTVVVNTQLLERRQRLYILNDADVLEGNFGIGATIQYNSRSLRVTPFVTAVRAMSQLPITISKLSKMLQSDFPTLGADWIEQTLLSLISLGLLLDCNRPYPDELIFERLAKPEALKSSPPGMSTILRNIVEIGAHEADSIDVATLRSLDSALTESMRSMDIATSVSPLYQLDTGVTFSGNLPFNILDDVKVLASVMLRMGRVRDMSHLRDAFLQRYDSIDRLVDIAELLSPDFGLDMSVGFRAEAEGTELTQHLSHIMRAIRDRSSEVALSHEQLNALLPDLDSQHMPESFELAFGLCAKSNDAIANGEYLLIPGDMLLGASAGSSVSRFSWVLPADSASRLKNACREHWSNNCLHTELVYLPGAGHYLNVMIRPFLAEAVVGLAPPTVDPPTIPTIAISDLVVGIDKGRLAVYSRSRQARLCIHQSHMLNVDAVPSSPLARLLHAIASDGSIQPSPFTWPHEDGLPFMPRVRAERVIVSQARWNLNRSDFMKAPSPNSYLDKWRAEWDVPNVVRLSSADDKLPVDLRRTEGCETLLEHARRSIATNIRLEELINEDSSFFRVGSTPHRVEFVTSIFNISAPAIEMGPRRLHGAGERRFGSGTDWTYVKLYCARGSIDTILLNYVSPFIQACKAGDILTRWFFVRYVDTGYRHHVRLRLKAKVNQERAIFEELLSFCLQMRDADIIEDYAFDSYDRETDRYGGPAQLDILEQWFHNDSEYVLRHLSPEFDSFEDRIAKAVISLIPMLRTAFLDDTAGLVKWAKRLTPQNRKLGSGLQQLLRRSHGDISEALNDASHLDDNVCWSPDLREDVLLSLIHMHHNRFGVLPIDEDRAAAFLRAAVISSQAKPKE